MFAPVFEKAIKELAEKYSLEKIDIDQLPQLASEYEVMSVPTLLHISNGKVVKKRAGAFPTVTHLQKWIEG